MSRMSYAVGFAVWDFSRVVWFSHRAPHCGQCRAFPTGGYQGTAAVE